MINLIQRANESYSILIQIILVATRTIDGIINKFNKFLILIKPRQVIIISPVARPD